MPSTRPFNAAQQWFGFLGQEGPPAGGEPSSGTWPSSAPMNSIPWGELIMWRATILGGSACIQRCNPIFFRKRLKTKTPQFLYTNAISWSMFKIHVISDYRITATIRVSQSSTSPRGSSSNLGDQPAGSSGKRGATSKAPCLRRSSGSENNLAQKPKCLQGSRSIACGWRDQREHRWQKPNHRKMFPTTTSESSQL